MENDSPRRPPTATQSRNTETDRENWGSLSTLSQLTNTNTNSKSNNKHNTHSKAKALMDSGKGNNVDEREDNEEGEEKWGWEERSGLMTPPSSQQSQDVTKMLISPPPEEVLRMRGHHKQSSITSSGPFTPSTRIAGPASITRPASVNSKRKRPGVVSLNNVNPTSNNTLSTIDSPSGTAVVFDLADTQLPEATPNPKPRKQSKRHARTQSLDSPTRSSFARSSQQPQLLLTTPTKSKATTSKRVVIQSPHVSNPDADFIPPMSIAASSSGGGFLSARALSRRSRSATPIPLYEPPTEVFTPPREVTISPPHPPPSRSRRKSRAASAVSTKQVTASGRVKKEMPEIDWSTPMPPPSPGDDPLLLSGKPRARKVRGSSRGESSPTRGWRTSRSLQSSSDPLREEEEYRYQDDETMELDIEDNAMDGIMAGSMPDLPTSDSAFDHFPPCSADETEAALPVFDLHAAPHDNGWSDSDSDDERGVWRAGAEGEGEYTGRFRMMMVPTKVDPPTSGTRGRMDEWGRPISPFPPALKRRFSLPSVGEQEAGDDQDRHELPVLDDEEPEEVVGDVAAQIETESEAQVIEGQELTIEAEASLVFGDAASDGEAELVDVAQDAAPLLRENTPAPQPEEVVDDSLVEDEEGDYDMRLELPAAEDEPVEPEHVFTSFEEESAQEQPLEEEVPPQETFERSSAAPDVPPKILEESFSFARELSVEEEEELEEESVDRELSVEPRHDDEDDPESRRSLNGRCNSSPLRFSNSAEPFPSFDDDIEYCAQNEATVEAEDDSSSGDESDFVQDSVVTISSNDPLVAARAAAILKQHDYDLLPKVVLKHRRLLHLTAEASSRKARRRSVADAGVSKAGSAASKAQRRATLGGMIGDRVFIPGSPAMTLPQLLMQAEERLEQQGGVSTPSPKVSCVRWDTFKTPVSKGSTLPFPIRQAQAQEWTKNEWKRLDACFTDERLDVAERMCIGEGVLADVDDVKVEDVVDRFVEMMGGSATVDAWGSLWDRNSLITRTRALQKKQRAGHFAPPTPGRPTPSSTPRLSDVPIFTPLTRLRPQPPARRPKLPPAVEHSPFDNLQSQQPQIHGSLLAPRYSHLLEEAVAISQEELEIPSGADMSVTSDDSEVVDLADNFITNDEDSVTFEREPALSEQPSPGISNRVKGFFFSYLPTLSKSTSLPKQSRPAPQQPGLPLPPPEVLGKSRGPISTPMRPPAPRVIPPKEQVHLHPAPVAKKSALPRPSKPQRLVNLHPTPPLVADPAPIQRSRRSSGGSVKDLVKNFEDLDSQKVRKSSIKRVRSIGDWHVEKADRPAWRP